MGEKRYLLSEAMGLMGMEATSSKRASFTTSAKRGKRYGGWKWRREPIRAEEKTNHAQKYVYILEDRPAEERRVRPSALLKPPPVPPVLESFVGVLADVQGARNELGEVAKALGSVDVLCDDTAMQKALERRASAKRLLDTSLEACVALVTTEAPRLLWSLAEPPDRSVEVAHAERERDEMEVCWREAEAQLEEARARADQLDGENAALRARVASLVGPVSIAPAMRTSDKPKVLVVGGSMPSAKRLAKLEGRLDAWVEWLPSESQGGFRRESAAARRIGSDEYAAVLLTKFARHGQEDVLKPACQEANVPYSRVPEGAGTDAIARAYRRALGGQEAA